MEFTTVSSNGLLLYMQGTVHDDFFALELLSGRLFFSYNLGSGRAQIQTTGSYNDGTLHRVRLLKLVHLPFTVFCLIGGSTA